MAFNVRIFGYRGIAQINQSFVKQYNADSVFVLNEPYEPNTNQVLVCDGATPYRSAVVAGDESRILRVEVPDSKVIRYEICPPGRTKNAGSDSPSLSGNNSFQWGSGYTISIVDAANFP